MTNPLKRSQAPEMKTRIIKTAGILFPVFCLVVTLYAQETERKTNFSGYLSNMQTVMFQDIDSAWLTDNLIHNRLNFSWFPSENFNLQVEMRNRFIFGEFVNNIPGYSGLIDRETGWFDLSGFVLQGKSYLLHSTIDRAWADLTRGKWELRLGRQRINWGQNFVWNPNDIFNTCSFFDFDYPERPGSDAIRIRYYTGASSVVETALKVDAMDKLTAAMKIGLNRCNYDFQFIGGVLSAEDIAAGFGWAGDISGTGFRGEITYLHPMEKSADTSGILIAALGGDYTFSNSLHLQAEILYNGAILSVGGFEQYYYMPLTVKTISFTDWSMLVGVSYPVSPLFQASANVMVFPSLKGFFAGPSCHYSIGENFRFSMAMQYFSGEFEKQTVPGQTEEERQNLFLGYLRFKYHF